MKRTLHLILAHPDDEIYAAGGLVAGVHEDFHIFLHCLSGPTFRQEPSSFYMKERMKITMDFCDAFGVEYRGYDIPPMTFGKDGVLKEFVSLELPSILLGADCVVTHVPDLHPDHCALSLCVDVAARKTSVSLYKVFTVQSLFTTDLKPNTFIPFDDEELLPFISRLHAITGKDDYLAEKVKAKYRMPASTTVSEPMCAVRVEHL